MSVAPTIDRPVVINRGPKPSPSPLDGEDMAAAVLNPTLADTVDFGWHVGLRVAGRLAFSWPKAWLWALATQYPRPIADTELAFLLQRTALARAVTPKLDPQDEAAFAPLMTDPKAVYFKADFSAFAHLDLVPGCYAAATVTLLEVPAAGDWTIRAVKINDLVVEPRHGQAWELTKYFVMQGLSQHMTTCHHVPVHFPNDAINAVTRTHLPPAHPIRKLLQPHFRFSLALNNTALHSPVSVLYNSQLFPYTPYAFTGESLCDLAVTGHGGVPGNSAYRRFSFSPHAHRDVAGDYGVFLGLYHGVIRKLVRQVVVEVPLGDAQVSAWADEIAKWVRGFPTADGVLDPDALADVLASVMLTVTVMHAAEHHDYALVDPAKVPHRLRVPPPTSTDIPAFDPRKLATKRDAFRHWMAWNMFYRGAMATRLIDAEYGFASEALQRAVFAFKAELRELDASMPVRRSIPLELISASIQF